MGQAMRQAHDSSQRHRRTMLEIFLGLVILAFAIWLFLALSVDAHDSWISRGGHRNGAGEWCCGGADCLVLPESHVSARAGGYLIVVRQPIVTGTVDTTST